MKTKYNKFFTRMTSKGLGLLFASIMVLSSGCNLDEDVYGFYTTDDFFSNTGRLTMGVNGVYATLSSPRTYGQYWMVYDTDTDISHVKGAGTGHTARDLGHYNAYSTHSWLQESWAMYYQGIDRANTILDHKDEVQLKATEADTILYKNLIAQTKALRAIYYFDLVRLFGDVPYFDTQAKVTDPVNVPKTERSVVYDKIITDLNEAIPDLKWYNEAIQTGERISKGAAMGMLARIYLFRGGYSLYGSGAKGELKRPDNYREYYQEAKILIDNLISTGPHGLLDSYERVFRNMCELINDPYENMFEISYYSPTGLTGTTGVMGTYNGPEINQASTYGRANSFIKTHNFFDDTYETTGDLRRDVSVAKFSIDATNTIKNINKNQSYNWSPGKWRRNWQTGEVKDNNNTDVNVVLLRYADILLMRAEIENELNGGPNTLAIEAINQVYRRAFGKPYLTPDANDFKLSDFPDKQTFFDYLYLERARELCFEGHRRMDLIRWGLLEKAVTDTKKQFDDAIAAGTLRAYSFDAGFRFKPGVHELYPIPDYDVRESQYAIIQNPGY